MKSIEGGGHAERKERPKKEAYKGVVEVRNDGKHTEETGASPRKNSMLVGGVCMNCGGMKHVKTTTAAEGVSA